MTSNRLANIFVAPCIIEAMFKHGTSAVQVVQGTGIPADAQLRACGYDADRGKFYLTFEHESFKPLEQGERIPETRTLFTYHGP